MATPPVREVLLHFMPEKCYEEIFVSCHVHVPCLKFILNKISGFWILLDTLLAPLPQLSKILWRGSAAGLSLTSTLLQLYAVSCPVVFAMASRFPLFVSTVGSLLCAFCVFHLNCSYSAYGERLVTLAQSAAIVFLILHYRGETLKGMLFLGMYSGAMFLLGSYAAAAVVSLMQDSSVAALTASKALQAGTNFCNGHTGQLSSLSVFLSLAGSLCVAFVSLQETGSVFASLLHILSACLSCVLLTQILRCRSSTAKKKTE